MAQVHFHMKEFERAINLYKQILHTIELSLLDKKREENGEVKDERLVQMIYFTLSNIGLCMEMLERIDDARLMFLEQFEISKLIKNRKFKANALLNLVNLCLNKTKLDSADAKKTPREQAELISMLRELFDIYQELEDVSGKLFTSQCLAYCYHTTGRLAQAIDFYEYNIDLSRKTGHSEMIVKSVFNLSLCFKMQRRSEEAYQNQLEYLRMAEERGDEYARFVSLGIIADLLFDINKSHESCQSCIQIHVDRLKIMKTSTEPRLLRAELKCRLISDCLESIAKCYFQLENYQQVLKFKLLQVELQNELEQTNVPSALKQKLKIWLEIGNLFLHKFEEIDEAWRYFEMVQEGAARALDLSLEALAIGSLGICKQRKSDFDSAADLYKQQTIVLEKKMKSLEKVTQFVN